MPGPPSCAPRHATLGCLRAAGPVAEDPTHRRPASSSLTQALAAARDRVLAIVRQHPFPTAVGAGGLVVGLAVSLASYALQSHFTADFQAGKRLSGWENFLRLGDPWQALVPVVLAGLLATWGAVRMESAPPEPPLSLGTGETTSAGQLRAALRAERRAVGADLLVMSALVLVVLVRVLVYLGLALSGSRLA